MGVTAAFIFAAQILNFPIVGGTSGHSLGGVLAAVLLGPARGLVVMATILIVRAFLFGDGGLTALGANIFNMGVVGAVVVFPARVGIHALIDLGDGAITAGTLTIIARVQPGLLPAEVNK